MGTQSGVLIRGSAKRGTTRKGARSRARPACLVAILCIVAVAACSNAAPSVPASVPSSAGASGPSASGPSASEPSTSTPPASSATVVSFNACAVLPAAALSKIVGAQARATAMPSAGWIAGQCAWSNATAGFFRSVGTASSLQKASDPAAPDAKAKLAEFQQRASATAKPRVITGIGDGAVLATTGMAAYKGGTYVEVTKLKLTDDQLIKIVTLAVTHL
jgi:hypothetical protein